MALLPGICVRLAMSTSYILGLRINVSPAEEYYPVTKGRRGFKFPGNLYTLSTKALVKTTILLWQVSF